MYTSFTKLKSYFSNFSRPRLIIMSVVLLLILGVSPFSLIRRALGSLSKTEATVNFYAGSALVASSTDYKNGWWSEKAAVGKPEVSVDGDILAFSDTNSAFYAGGKFDLVLGDFALADKYVGINEQEATATESRVEVKQDEIISSSTEEKVEIVASSSEETVPSEDASSTIEADEKNVPKESSSTESEMPKNELDVQVIELDVPSKETTPTVESETPSVDKEPAAEVTPPAMENIDNPTDNAEAKPVSRRGGWDFFCGGDLLCAARAEEQSDLTKFGDFKAAKIAMSLAAAFKDGGDVKPSEVTIWYALDQDNSTSCKG